MNAIQAIKDRQEEERYLVNSTRLVEFNGETKTVAAWCDLLHVRKKSWAYWRKKKMSYESILKHFIESNENRERKKKEKIAEMEAQRKRRKFQKMKQEYDDAQAEIHDGIEGRRQ